MYGRSVHASLSLCSQLEKVKEFAVSLKATDDHNFQYAGTNIETIITEKVHVQSQLVTIVFTCTCIHIHVYMYD